MSHLFYGMLVYAATISCTSLRVDKNISQIVDKERGAERRLACQVLSRDRDRSGLSIENRTTLEWGQPVLRPLDPWLQKAETKNQFGLLFTC